MEKGKSRNFLLQGSILAIAAIIAKMIGVVYRVPLTNIIGDNGNSYYSTANEIYTIILMISSFSLPLAVSRMMSERIGRGEYKNARKVFFCAMRFAVAAGLIMAILTRLLAGVVSKYIMNFELAKYGLQVIAPAILVFAITGTFRGYFQGFGNMVPTATSQVIEQIVNAIVSIMGAAALYRYGLSLAKTENNEMLAPAWGAAGATFGTVVSVTIAMVFMILCYRRQARSFDRLCSKDKSRVESDHHIYKILIATIVPIVLSTLIYNISSVLDQGVFNVVLKGQGYSEQQYGVIWGIYVGKFRVLMNVALCLASSIGPAIVPSMAEYDLRDKKSRRIVGGKVGMAIRFTMLFSIPCAFGLAALGGPIVTMLFHPQTGMPLTVGIMRLGAPVIILYALSTVTTAILQGLGDLRGPLRHCGIALVIHLIALYIMLKRYQLNIFGVMYANMLFALIICILNAWSIARLLRYRQEVFKTFLIPTIASAIMAFVCIGVYSLLHLVFGVTICTIIAILAGVFVYLFVMSAFRGITPDEILMVPKGKSLLRLLRKFGMFR